MFIVDSASHESQVTSHLSTSHESQVTNESSACKSRVTSLLAMSHESPTSHQRVISWQVMSHVSFGVTQVRLMSHGVT